MTTRPRHPAEPTPPSPLRTSRGKEAATPSSPLQEAYERHLRTRRGLADLTIRNYLADIQPFLHYLDRQGVPLEDRAVALRRFIERTGLEQAGREYRSLVRDYVSWLLEKRLLESGKRAGKHGHARASVIRSLAALRSFVRYLISEGLLPEAPLWARRSTLMSRFTPKVERRLPDVLSAQDAASLVEAPVDPRHASPRRAALDLRDAALLELLYGGGLRVSEATGLDLDHLDLRDRTVRLWGKGSKERMVPLGRPAVSALQRYLADARPGLISTASGKAVFLNRSGGRLTVRSMQNIVRAYALRAGLREGVHPHTLRHSFATHLLDGGADLRIVQELLGHSSPSATQVYTHISQTEARRVYLAAHPLAKKS